MLLDELSPIVHETSTFIFGELRESCFWLACLMCRFESDKTILLVNERH